MCCCCVDVEFAIFYTQKGWLMDGPEEERSWHLGPNRPLLSRADLFIIKFGPREIFPSIFLLHQTK